MHRRRFLRLGGTLGLIVGGGIVTAAEGSADPRPEPVSGTRPNSNIPTTSTGALPGETTQLPAGDWILHDNGWSHDDGDEEALKEFAEQTTQTFVIDGETFVLDGLDDWDYSVDSDGVPHIVFEHFTPPKRKGKTYEMRWDVVGHPVENWYPVANQLEIVGRN